ncbi:HlyU family transcriptional regulator [Allorhizobium undicola]|uniref:HlyU family transcriptional regulator n=1 Tax=Allorhizobium undicola TaxID=78527 RepID=UPI003D34518B
MASFISKILSVFSGPAKGEAAAPASEPQIHADCRIFAEPLREGAQYRLAGRIEKDVDGRVLTRSFIRADLFTGRDEALEFTFRKGRQIIDQSGPSLFADGEASRQV